MSKQTKRVEIEPSPFVPINRDASYVAPLSPTLLKQVEEPSKSASHSNSELLKALVAGAKTNLISSVSSIRHAITALTDKKSGKAINISLDTLISVLFFTWLIFVAFHIKLLSPSPAYLFTFTFVGAGIGLALSFLYYSNRAQKQEINQVLGLSVGIKGLQSLTGNLPSWLSYTEQEKMEWFNTIIAEIWPFVDAAVCKKVREEVEKACDSALKSAKFAIKKGGFKQLTFGDAPIRIESIWVNEDVSNGLEMELSVRWSGDANITLAIELSTGVYICPSVEGISFAGTLRVRLYPLCTTAPGVGGVMVTFPKEPRFKYHLNFGKLGGSVTAAPVKMFVNSMVKRVLNDMLVWPQRLVIPVIPNMPGVSKLFYRHQGIVKVEVIKAEKLIASDSNLIGSNTSDPIASLTTDGQYVVETKQVKKTLEPVWNETFWLLVQEPLSQEMRVTVSDKDLFSFKDSFGAKEEIGRGLVKIHPAVRIEPQPLTQWYHLGDGDWGAAEGCGKGCGRIQLRMQYRSFHNFQANETRDAENGILVVRVLKCSKLTKTTKPLSVFCRVKCNKEVYQTKTVTTKDGKDHLFDARTIKEFYNIRYDSSVKITVVEDSLVGSDEIGIFSCPITDIANSHDVNPVTGLKEYGLRAGPINLEESESGGVVWVVIRFVPCI